MDTVSELTEMHRAQEKMHDGLWLSILVPVYNVASYLEACLASIGPQAQSDDGVEVLILDDASTDDSPALLARLARQYGLRIMPAHAVNQGLSAARNDLLTQARGEYVWFVDSDDVLMPDAVSTLRACLDAARHPVDQIIFDHERFEEHGKSEYRRSLRVHGPVRMDGPLQAFAEVLKAEQFYAWARISRRALWDGLQFPVSRYFEDIPVSSLLALRAQVSVYLPSALIRYRSRPGSIVSVITQLKLEHMMAGIHDVAQVLRRMEPPCPPPLAFAFNHFCIRRFIMCCKDVRRWGIDCQPPDRFHTLLQQLLLWPLSQVLRAYLLRGWLWRCLRLTWYWRRH